MHSTSITNNEIALFQKNQLFEDLIKAFLLHVQASDLSTEVKHDTKKVIDCFLYLNDNLSFYKWAIDNRYDRTIYANRRDFNNRVLRDTHYTGFHINYDNSSRALSDLHDYFQQLIVVLQQLTLIQQLGFANKLRFDKTTGCLEKRISGGLIWATEQLENRPPQLHDIMEACNKVRGEQSVSIVDVAVSYCQKHHYTQCIYEDVIVPISVTLLKKYAKDILREDDADNEEKKEDTILTPPTDTSNELYEKYTEFCNKGTLQILTYNNTLRLEFSDINQAALCARWLTQHPVLKNSNNLDNESLGATSSVYFSPRQYDAIMGAGTFAKLMPHQKIGAVIDDLKKNNNLLNIEKWETLLNQPEFTVEFNQQQLMNNIYGLEHTWMGIPIEQTEITYIITYLLKKLPSESAHKLICLLHKNVLSNLLAQPDNYGLRSVLHTAAKYLSAKTFKLLIQRVTREAYTHASVKKDKWQQTSLYSAAHYQTTGGFELLIQLLTPEALSTSLLTYNIHNNLTILHAALNEQDTKTCNLLIDRSTPEALAQTLPLQYQPRKYFWEKSYSIDGYTCLHIAANYAKLMPLLNKTPKEAINAACLKLAMNKKSVLDFALSQPAQAIKLLDIVDDATFTFLLNHNKHPHKIINLITHLKNKDKALLCRLLNHFPEQIVKHYAEKWLEGIDTPSALKETIYSYLSTHKNNLNEKELAYYHTISLPEEEKMEVPTITTSSMEKIKLADIDDRENIEKLWQHGLRSWHDQHILKKYLRAQLQDPTELNGNKLQLFFILNTLLHANRLLTGAKITYTEFLSFPSVIEQYRVFVIVFRCIQQQNTLIKIIKTEHFPDFIKQLQDYSYRPKLRKEIDEKTATHKLVHLENKIIRYESHKTPHKKPKQYASLKKQSVTLLNHDLLNPVFGEHEANRQLVGFLFNQSLCLTAKGYFKSDRGTRQREWVGTENDVIKYQQKIQDISFKTLDEFRNFVKENPDNLNEALARLTREACMAIVIAKDGPEVRAEAKRRAKIVNDELKTNVPIVLYNNKTQNIAIFSEEPILLVAEAAFLSSTANNQIVSLISPPDDEKADSYLENDIITAEKILHKIITIIAKQITNLEKELLKDFKRITTLMAEESNSLKYFSSLINTHPENIVYEYISHFCSKHTSSNHYFRLHKTQLDTWIVCMRTIEAGADIIREITENPSYFKQKAQLDKVTMSILLNFSMHNTEATTAARIEAFARYFSRQEVYMTVTRVGRLCVAWTSNTKSRETEDINQLLAEYENQKISNYSALLKRACHPATSAG